MIRDALVLTLLIAAAGGLLGCACTLIDHATDALDRRRRLRRLNGTTVVRLPFPSPDRRGESVPRLAAVHSIRRRA